MDTTKQKNKQNLRQMSDNKPQTDSESATRHQETGELRVFYSSSGEKRPASKRKSILGAEWRSILTRHGRSMIVIWMEGY